MSRYSERHADGWPGTSHNVTRLDVTVLEPVDQPAPPTASRDDQHATTNVAWAGGNQDSRVGGEIWYRPCRYSVIRALAGNAQPKYASSLT
jgi:hypothetical protein